MSEIPNARITPTAIYIGNTLLPGLVMEGGVIVEPGGTTGLNVITVKFLVGQVIVEDTDE